MTPEPQLHRAPHNGRALVERVLIAAAILGLVAVVAVGLFSA